MGRRMQIASTTTSSTTGGGGRVVVGRTTTPGARTPCPRTTMTPRIVRTGPGPSFVDVNYTSSKTSCRAPISISGDCLAFWGALREGESEGEGGGRIFCSVGREKGVALTRFVWLCVDNWESLE